MVKGFQGQRSRPLFLIVCELHYYHSYSLEGAISCVLQMLACWNGGGMHFDAMATRYTVRRVYCTVVWGSSRSSLVFTWVRVIAAKKWFSNYSEVFSDNI